MCAPRGRGTGTWHRGPRRHAGRKGCYGHRGASAPAGDELRQRRCQLAGRSTRRCSWVVASGGGHHATVMSQGSILCHRRAWATCARISGLAPSRAALLCLQEDHGLPHPPSRRGDSPRGREKRQERRAQPSRVPRVPRRCARLPGSPRLTGLDQKDGHESGAWLWFLSHSEHSKTINCGGGKQAAGFNIVLFQLCWLFFFPLLFASTLSDMVTCI